MIPCVCLKGARVFGAMKGAADGGLDIPHRLIELCYGQHLKFEKGWTRHEVLDTFGILYFTLL